MSFSRLGASARMRVSLCRVGLFFVLISLLSAAFPVSSAQADTDHEIRIRKETTVKVNNDTQFTFKTTEPGGQSKIPNTLTLTVEDDDDSEEKKFEDLKGGTYTFEEQEKSGWEFVELSCECPGVTCTKSGSKVTIQFPTGGSDKKVRCTWKNKPKVTKHSIEIKKETTKKVDQNTNFTFKTTEPSGQSKIPDPVTVTVSNNQDEGSKTYSDLKGGTYTIEEEQKNGWNFKTLKCKKGGSDCPSGVCAISNDKVTLNLPTSGDDLNIKCTWENEPVQKHKITIKKKTTKDVGIDTKFKFSTTKPSGDSGLPSLVELTVKKNDDDEEATFNNLKSGTYTIEEQNTSGWQFKNLTCKSGQQNCSSEICQISGAKVTLNLASGNGHDIRCTWENEENKTGKIILRKKIVKDTGGTINLPSTKFTLNYSGASAGSGYAVYSGNFSSPWTKEVSGSPFTVPIGNYNVTEGTLPQAPDGYKWVQNGVHCEVKDKGGDGSKDSQIGENGAFTLAKNETVECVVENLLKREKGTIKLIKKTEGPDAVKHLVGTNEFTLKLNSNSEKIQVSGFGTSSPVAKELPVGTYTFSEVLPSEGPAQLPGSKWMQKSLSCTVKDGANGTTASGTTVNLGAGGVVECKAVNEVDVPKKKGAIKIIKKVTHGTSDDKFAFTTLNLSSFELGDGGIKDFPNLDSSKTYKVTEEPNEHFFAPEIYCQSSLATVTKEADGRTITVKFDEVYLGDPSAVCTFFNKKRKDDRAEDVTKLYINRRVDNLLTHGPDRARVLRRLDEQQQESLKDGGSYEPLKLSGSVDGDGGAVKFSTSLSQLRSAAAAATARKIDDAALGFHESYAGYMRNGLTQRFDLWVEGQLSTYDDSTGGIEREGDFKILYVGMDYAISPGFLIGALVQIDRTDERVRDDDLRGSVEGTGWMAGPYLGIKLRDNLFFDARAAWGQSDNDLTLKDDIVGYRKGSFDTDRWLATATLTGNYHFGSLRVSPQVGIAYGNETSDAYKTTLGQEVDSVDVTIGRLTFGPEFGYRTQLQDGTVIEPHLSIKGIWNFDQETLDLSTGPVEPEEFRGQVEGGVLIKTPDGYSIRAAGSYDGIGDKDLEAWSAKAWLNVPLN